LLGAALILRVLRKLLVDPFRYGLVHYDAQRYWRDRFRRYGMSDLRGSGNESLSPLENLGNYNVKEIPAVMEFIEQNGGKLEGATVIDIGCGQGAYTNACYARGVGNYIGLDVTDELFPELRKRFPDYKFCMADVTDGLWVGFTADVVMCIDVLEHVTRYDALMRAIENVWLSTRPGGIAVIGPFARWQTFHLFYLRRWRPTDLPPWLLQKGLSAMLFKGGSLLAVKR